MGKIFWRESGFYEDRLMNPSSPLLSPLQADLHQLMT